MPEYELDDATILAGGSAKLTDLEKGSNVDSASDARTVNNVMRHEYRVLSGAEKEQMQRIKDLGLVLHSFIQSVGASRELSLAATKVEEAVMWAVKHITK